MSQVALVTGSSRGIGLATAEALAREGFAIAVNGPVADDELARAVDRITALGARVIAAPFDVTDIAGHDAQLARIEAELGPLTTLVNNAGVGVLQRGDILDVSEASWDRCIAVNSIEARVPFGDLDFVKYVMSVDPEMKLNKYKKGKYLLRHAFEGDYLPLPILYREKAAFSDAVGHSMVDYLKAYAETKYTDDEMKLRAAKYPFATPFTKESLLYREIFEKYYPGQAEMIVDYWMPNKAWPNCAVNDPSARVLKNYGDSGK